MFLLDFITVLCMGPMIGVEFAVSAFVNPILWNLSRSAQAAVTPLFARRLGTAMPFWYAASFVLLIAEAVARHRERGFGLLVAACVIWAAVIVLTLIFLVPLNNRLARFEADVLTDEAFSVHRTWDKRHRLRVAALVVAFLCALIAIGRC